MMLVPLLVVSLILEQNKFSGLLSFFFLIMMVTGIIATMTRSTWVGMLLALVLLPLLPSVRDYLKKNARRFGLIAGILALSVFFWPKSRLGGYANPLQRIMEIKKIKTEGEYGPWHQRMLIWSCCWTMTQEHPVIGKGWGSSNSSILIIRGARSTSRLFRHFRTHANNAHNEVIEIWSQTGFVGMGVYVWVWVILVGFGVKCAKHYRESAPHKSFGLGPHGLGPRHVHGQFLRERLLHFAVPGFLFWWQAGLLFSVGRESEPGKNIAFGMVYQAFGQQFLQGSPELRDPLHGRERVLAVPQGISGDLLLQGLQGLKDLERPGKSAGKNWRKGWLWYPREVNMNYELANTYAKLAQQTAQAGLVTQSAQWRKKAIWGYMESLRSNAGYDEIFFNLASIQTQMDMRTDDFADIEIETPRGLKAVEPAKNVRGAVFNYSRAIAINPSLRTLTGTWAPFIFRTAPNTARSHPAVPAGRPFLPERTGLSGQPRLPQMEDGKFDEAIRAIRSALEIDPFNEGTRRDIRVILSNAKRQNDPLMEADRLIPLIQPLIQSRSWRELV